MVVKLMANSIGMLQNVDWRPWEWIMDWTGLDWTRDIHYQLNLDLFWVHGYRSSLPGGNHKTMEKVVFYSYTILILLVVLCMCMVVTRPLATYGSSISLYSCTMQLATFTTIVPYCTSLDSIYVRRNIANFIIHVAY